MQVSDFEELHISAGKTEKINYICQMQHHPNLMHVTGNLIHPHLTHCSLGPGDWENFIMGIAILHIQKCGRKY